MRQRFSGGLANLGVPIPEKIGELGDRGIAFRGIGRCELAKHFHGGEPDLVVPSNEKCCKNSDDAVALGRGGFGELYQRLCSAGKTQNFGGDPGRWIRQPNRNSRGVPLWETLSSRRLSERRSRLRSFTCAIS